MCGRFSQGEPSHRISDYFGAYPDEDLPDGLWNVPPTETIRIVVERDGERCLAAARWGFQPFWADGSREAPARSWINARAETAWDSTAFGPALRATRCIVPADAFYEWDRSASPSQPYAIGPAEDSALLAMAGIWSATRHAPPTVAILTTQPNELVARVHDRMPVILPAELVSDWLDPAATPADLAPMLTAAEASSLRMWPVSTAVNRVQVDGPELLRQIDLPPTLGLA
jgi:putative SOS response-associated peptidase YedK